MSAAGRGGVKDDAHLEDGGGWLVDGGDHGSTVASDVPDGPHDHQGRVRVQPRRRLVLHAESPQASAQVGEAAQADRSVWGTTDQEEHRRIGHQLHT